MIRICEKIKKILDTTPGLTQRGLAERMGVNAAAVNRMVYGRRAIKVEEVPVIEDYLGVKLDISGGGQDFEFRPEAPGRGRQGISDAASLLSSAPAVSLIPVYGAVAGGIDNLLNLAAGNVAGWVQRHPAQMGIRDAFAVYAFSDSMEPRYYRGELVYIHPGRPAEQGKDCMVEMKNGDAIIARLVRRDAQFACLVQLNPACEKNIPKEEIKAIYAVVGRG